MKRILVLVILAALLLAGCNLGEEPENMVTFYYLRSDVAYGSSDGVIASEQRELSAGDTDLFSILALYMAGPSDPALKLPLSAGTRLSRVRQDGSTLTVTFSTELAYLEGMDLSIACACIGYTCFSLTDAQTVRIEAPATAYGDALSFTVTRDTFLLFDDTTKSMEADSAS